MSAYDNWLLEGSEPEPWDEESAPHGLCDFCVEPLEEDESGDIFCAGCEPRVALEDSPVRLTVTFEAGRGRLSGWSADAVVAS